MAAPHTETVWQGDAPMCDFCTAGATTGVPSNTPAKYDGRTIFGCWALMCQRHFDMMGMGLGLGRGQWLVVKP